MDENAKDRVRMRAGLVLMATAAMFAINAIAGAGYINGVTPAAISDRYPTLLTPAGYGFSIWGLIYLWLAAFSVYQFFARLGTRSTRVRTLYILSCVFNSAWIFFWHYGQIGAALVTILLLLASLLLIEISLRELRSVADTWLARAPFGIYFGWVTVASIVNLLVYMSSLGVDMNSASMHTVSWAMILIAAGLAVLVRIMLKNFFYPLAVAWAMTAIAIQHSGETGIVVSCALGVVVCLITTGSFVTELKDSSSE